MPSNPPMQSRIIKNPDGSFSGKTPPVQSPYQSRIITDDKGKVIGGTTNFNGKTYTNIGSNNITNKGKGSSGGSGGGMSRINPTTGKGEYVLPSGVRVNATSETSKAISQGRSDIDIIMASAPGNGASFFEAKAIKSSSPMSFSNSNQNDLSAIGMGRGYFSKGTSMISTPKFDIKTDVPISLSPQIYTVQTGSFSAPDTGKAIPIIDYRYYPGVGTSKTGLIETRTATEAEKSYFIEQTSATRISTLPIPSKTSRVISETYSTFKADLYQTNVGGSKMLNEFGVSDKNIKTFANVISYGSPLALVPGGKKFSESAVTSIITDVRDKPFSNIALVGLGGAFGAASEGIPIVARGATSIVGFSKYAPGVEKAFKIGTVGGGAVLTGMYAVPKTIQIVSAPDAATRGAITGSAITEIGFFGLGFYSGTKAARIIEGGISTFGRSYIDVPQGDFPTAPTSKQVQMFKENIYPELGPKPGAFHTTSSTFWQEGKLTPSPGTSELSGVYGSTIISRPFAKLSGSSSNQQGFNINQALANLFRTGKPGVAYLMPEGFRYSPAVKVPGVPRSPLGYQFTQPAKVGVMDIPLIKSEIEAIARPEAGSYVKTGGKFYTEISGVRVPIDTFVPEKLFGKQPTQKIQTFGSDSYRYPSSSKVFSLYNPSVISSSIFSKSNIFSGSGSSSKSSSSGITGGSSITSSSDLPGTSIGSSGGSSSGWSFISSTSKGSSYSSIFGSPSYVPPYPSYGGGLSLDFEPGKRKQGRQKKKRSISIAAAIFDWKSTSVDPNEITGFVSRNIITGKRRRR